ncbi:nucleoside deaminase [Methanobacterium paludis]|uniref:Cytosine deaminase n=1 Tax=Methanobacterium paludis (strain DSM 25820 / JCM 18151 / SWAN1) TaxID=868131 RepID=F6D769_METPW|nr:nucleoside deaminase [Methanobacterium paludis]AEG19028.1 Cytosine deaminase [Methanobacterium paludis]
MEKECYMEHYKFMAEALKEAKKALNEGGIPIGAILVNNGKIVSKGHNKLLQRDSPILHAEVDCIESAGRLNGKDYKNSTLYTTLSPCDMCSGMILLYKIPKVVMGENKTLKGPEDYLMKNGVELINLDMGNCKELIESFIRKNPEVWDKEIEKIS